MMKKTLSILISLILVIAMLTSTACNLSKGKTEGTTEHTETKAETQGDTKVETDSDTGTTTNAASSSSTNSETETETESESKSEVKSETETESESASETESVIGEIYTDLSGEFGPTIEIDNSAKFKTSSVGVEGVGDVVISFDDTQTGYSFASFGMSGKHDAYSCSDCKYVEKNGAKAFYMHSHSSQHIGISVDLENPIDASLVSGVEVSIMTNVDITAKSEIRLFKRNETNSSAVINLSGYPDLSGATDDWKTINFNFSSSNIASLTEEDGYIHGFKMMLRDKDGTDIYIKDITFKTSLDIEQLCEVDAIYGNYYGRGNALKAIADKIASNLSEAGITAEIELRTTSYTQNTTAKPGNITYKATITTSEGKEIERSGLTTVIENIDNTWIPLGHDTFVVDRDSKNQWKTGFDKSGIIALSNNTLSAPEGIATVQYAVIDKDADVTDESITWFAPHYLKLSANGIDALYVNVALDNVSALEEGKEYRFVLRGVTKNENYILHLDIPFTLSALSQDPINALDAAKSAIGSAKISCSADTENKAEQIASELKKAINNDNIAVSVTITADGMLGCEYNAMLSYVANIDADRFPSYTLDGEKRSDFFAYAGKAYTITQGLVYAEQTSDIVLTSPGDGQTDIRIASDEIVKFWDTDTDILITKLYDYKLGEFCDPTPVVLKWTDAGGSGKTYTVSVAESADFKNAWTYQVSDTTLDVYNLKAGQRYYWKVERDGISSATFAFETEGKYPRYILTDKVSNFRDLGGHMTLDGKTVKQGLAYRLSNFDAVNSSDIDIITNYLGIKTELDFRNNDETPSKLGDSVTAKRISIKWYAGIFSEGESEPIRQVFSVIADKNNYPIGYHCAIGRDRTGTVSILLLGLLGVDEDTILKEFMVSKLSVSGGGDGVSAPTLYNNYSALVGNIKSRYANKSDTFQGQVEAYLLSIGVTEDEIASIRENFLED